MTTDQLPPLNQAREIAMREFGVNSLHSAATLSLTELLIHAQNRTDDQGENPDVPPEFFADYLPLNNGSFILIEPHKPPRLEH